MRVWILSQCVFYEGGQIIGVYATEQLAEEYKEDHPLQSDQEYYELDEWGVKTL